MVQLSHPYMTTRQTIALTIWTFVGKVMLLLFNMLSKFVIAFLPKRSSLVSKEIQPVHPKGDHCWEFIGRTDAEAETPILWSPHVNNWPIWKDPDSGKDWGQEEKGMTGWDGWMASPTQRTWVWVNSGSWWRTGRPGVLRSMVSQWVQHNWGTELNWQKKKFKNNNSMVLFLKQEWTDEFDAKPYSLA